VLSSDGSPIGGSIFLFAGSSRIHRGPVQRLNQREQAVVRLQHRAVLGLRGNKFRRDGVRWGLMEPRGRELNLMTRMLCW